MSEVTATPAGRQLVWILDRARDTDPPSPEEVADRFDPSSWPEGWQPADGLREIRELLGSGGWTIEDAKHTEPNEVELTLVAADGRRWLVACRVADDDRVSGLGFRPAPPPGTVIRPAEPADARVLTELEHRTPLRLGSTRVTYDRGADYLAASRLMEEITILVAVVDGVPAGVYWGAVQHVRVGGEPKKLLIEHRVRVLPEYQRAGVFWELVSQVRGRHEGLVDSIAFYISPRNERMIRHVADVPRWKAEPVRMLLPCAELAGPPVGRPATPTDGVHDVLNACHGREELYVAHTPESLTARLSRDPALYGPDRLRVTGRAAVGVADTRLRMRFEEEDGSHESVRATALDHGFAPGGEDDYEALLRAWCAELAPQGVTDLAVFTSEGSPTYPVLERLARDREPFYFWSFDIEEPPDAVERGFYVDPVYF